MAKRKGKENAAKRQIVVIKSTGIKSNLIGVKLGTSLSVALFTLQILDLVCH
jgi:hypothetical protein